MISLETIEREIEEIEATKDSGFRPCKAVRRLSVSTNASLYTLKRNASFPRRFSYGRISSYLDAILVLYAWYRALFYSFRKTATV